MQEFRKTGEVSYPVIHNCLQGVSDASQGAPYCPSVEYLEFSL